MSIQDKKMLNREAVRSVIQQWNANRLDLFALSEPDENLLFHGVMRFFFQDEGQKIATKCIRVASDATVADVIETLIEKFRPDMRMLSVPNYALYEVHANGEERRLNPDEKPLLVQLNWHIDDREGRFLLRNIDQKATTIDTTESSSFKRKLSKREKKEQKKKEKLAKLNSDNSNGGGGENRVAEKLYTELPETSFTRSISNPEAVMSRRRLQKLEKKLQQFRSKDGGPDTGGTLKIYGESLCRDVPYKTLLLSIRDCSQAVVREMLSKYGLEKADPLHYCLVQVNSDGTEYILDDDECPLSILMNHPTSRGSIMFHVRRRPAEAQPRRRKKKPLGISNGTNNNLSDREGPMLIEVTHTGEGGRRIKLGSEPIEVGSANTNSLQLFGPSIQARHCLISLLDGICTVTPLHTDALTFVNGHHISQPTVLHNGSVVMFGRVASYRFVDSPSDGRYNLALSQSQLDSACLYESRSPTSPTSWSEEDKSSSPVAQQRYTGQDNSSHTLKEPSDQQHHRHYRPYQDKFNSLATTSSGASGGGNNTDEKFRKASAGGGVATATAVRHHNLNQNDSQSIHKEKELIGDAEGNIETETKSVSSLKSNGSNQESRNSKLPSAMGFQSGQEPILPAVLEFPETHQENFLRQVITELDVNAPNFKLAPVYTLYLCARYRASTHYRPELLPTERAHKLTMFLHHVANLIYSVIQNQHKDSRILAFWMANSSEFLHFLKSDRHISAFSVQAQEVLAESVQTAFRNLVNCFRIELSQTLNQFMSENIDHDSAAGFVLTVLGSAMALLRRCRVNAALTIQLFSQLFHYINVICFNTIVLNAHMCTAEWGKRLSERLQLLELWAERQGLELAADCHLAKISQCAQFLQAPKTCVEDIQQLACSCFRLNSLQMAALLQQEPIPRNLIDTAIRMAESVADELTRADGREVKLEESPELHLALLLPDDGFSCDVVRGIPTGLVDFLNPPQMAGMCRLAAQPTSVGLWTVYMHQFNARSPSEMSNKIPQPEIQVIKLQKNSNGMGLSIVAAKGAGQERLGIYIKSVVPGGAADADGRLQAGDQLLKVDGQSLIGITQERAADYLVRTGPVVTLEVAKQGAIYHGLATLLQQPSPVTQRGQIRTLDRTRQEGQEGTVGGQQLLNSKSVPVLHQVGNIGITNLKSRSTHNLINSNQSNDQGFYQNLNVYKGQGQHPALYERQVATQQSLNPTGGMHTTPSMNPSVPNRPTSTHFMNSSNNPNVNGSLSSLSYHPQGGNMSSLDPQQLQYAYHQGYLTNPNNRLKGIGGYYNRDGAQPSTSQQNLKMSQSSAPSMPNIAHTSGFVSNLTASQSMQNVTMISPGGHDHQGQSSNMEHQAVPNVISPSAQQNITNYQSSQKLATNFPGQSYRGQDTLKSRAYPMSRPEFVVAASSEGTTAVVGKQQTLVARHMPPVAPKPSPGGSVNPQMHYTSHAQDEFTPPLPPTVTHPLFKSSAVSSSSINYVASAGDPPKPAYYPVAANNQYSKNMHSANPWEREEREKEIELRREQIRQWRDQQIAELSALTHRTPQQEEQLKGLSLERDFEKRALEMEDQEDDGDNPYLKENIQEVIRLENQNASTVMHTPVANFHQTEIKSVAIPDSSASAGSNSADNVRSHQLKPSNGSNYQEKPVLTAGPHTQPKSILKNNRVDTVNMPSSSTSSFPSTSTLKSSKSTSFADEQSIHRPATETSSVSSIARNLAAINLENDKIVPLEEANKDYNNSVFTPPPPPPERNSSYLIMSQQQQKLRLSSSQFTRPAGSASSESTGRIPSLATVTTVPPTATTTSTSNPSVLKTTLTNTSIHTDSSNNNNYFISNSSSMTSPVSSTTPSNLQQQQVPSNVSQLSSSNSIGLLRDNKRVSFHDEENNLIASPEFTLEQGESLSPKQDANQFIHNATIMLQSPGGTDNWNTSVQSTPGVIGAQEVYNDPRQKRLQEQQQKQQEKFTESVPEKLSFKEKMKMFALESGDNQTPKDKLKISRAQRDIDAVH